MNIRQSGSFLGIWDGDKCQAQISWDVKPDCWEIGFLNCNDSSLMIKLLRAFRNIWRSEGRPVLEFNKRNQGGSFHRFVSKGQ